MKGKPKTVAFDVLNVGVDKVHLAATPPPRTHVQNWNGETEHEKTG